MSQKSKRETEQELAFIDAVKANKMIDAIKAYREWKGVGLKESTIYCRANWEDLRRKQY